MSFLEIRNIVKKYGGKTVLNSLSLSVNENEVLAVIGKSGAGKTTLLRCLNLLEMPDEGQIYLENNLLYDVRRDKDLSDAEISLKRLHFGLVFQSFNLFPQYTALENVTLAAELLRKDNKENIKKEAEEILTSLGLKDKLNSYPYQLSGGQQQRVAIGRALILNPQVLCFDEPTSALDLELSDTVAELIKSLKSDNKAIIVITHDMAFARKVADRIAELKDGLIIKNENVRDYFK